MVLPEGLLDNFGDDEPGDDADASAKHVVMVLGGDLLPELLVHGLMPGRLGAKDLAKADDEGVPLSIIAQKCGKADAFQEVHSVLLLVVHNSPNPSYLKRGLNLALSSL